jgi:hypothetical protein
MLNVAFSVEMLCNVMLSAIMPNVIMLKVVAPFEEQMDSEAGYLLKILQISFSCNLHL